MAAVEMGLTNNGYPLVKSTATIPSLLLPFDKAIRSRQYESFVHFFIEDYQFERIWNQPNKYVPLFRKFNGIIMPDFSVYYDMPLPMIRWNIYRNKFIAAFMQSHGIDVIPNVQIVEPQLWEDAIAGIAPNGVIAINCMGVKRRYFARRLLVNQIDFIIRELQPIAIVAYGNDCILKQFDNVINFENNHITRIRYVQRCKVAK